MARLLDRRVCLSPASSIWIEVRPAACNASVEDGDKTVEEWETRMTRVEVQRQGGGHTEMKCMHLWVMKIVCGLPNVSLVS